VFRINVVVAATSPDVKAEVIAEAVAARPDMNLVADHWVVVPEVAALLESVPTSPRCALVIVGRPAETSELASGWLAERPDIVVMHVDVVGDAVRIEVRAARLDPLLTALRELVERVAAHVAEEEGRGSLLDASIDWLHELLRDAVESVSDENGDVHGLSITRATLLQSLDAPSVRGAVDADAALGRALAAADAEGEPLAKAVSVFALTRLEFRMMLLALAPELDLRFQRCIGFLLDEIGRRAGTIGLYSALLGATARVRVELAEEGGLARWLVFDGHPAADEPLRVDPFLAQWLLGDRLALANEPRVRRAMRLVPWPGVALLQRQEEQARAAALIARGATPWIVLGGDDPAGWRALLELGAQDPIRIELAQLANVDVIDVEECARRVGRMARLTGAPLILDSTRAEESEGNDDWLRLFFAALDGTRCHAALICRDAARIVKLLGPIEYELAEQPALPPAARVAAIRAAATGAGAYLTRESVEAIANRYPLSVDGLEHAMRLASDRSRDFAAACREVASDGISRLAERIEPIFTLDEVVLPPDRKEQLTEIVDHVRFAPRVLDEWKFREQLPYGRGVTALFHGPSGTGKTMAAMAIARRLGIQVLRLDFSKVVSKYIGDTEKNIDRVFTDAQKSGSVILIDEADALLGKRSEVKDAHDRYANIEVAYLLQRMEAYEGLAILTTNMKQNLDPAFLRRLRFVVDFPRPDADAREKIWRQCLPDQSHDLDAAAFRQLGRKIDLAGGNIRQITLRAAFIAAAAGAQIGLEQIAHAARAEFAKLGMAPADIDLSAARRAA
jgi:AAA+ superfamily predicted ATPase